MTFQWYRVNPYTFEHILIEGATGNIYITTTEDIGYKIAVIGNGVGEDCDSYFHYISDSGRVLKPIEGYISEADNSSFTIHFNYQVGQLLLENLVIYDYDYNLIEDFTITNLAGGASFQVNFTTPLATESINIYYEGKSWVLVTNYEEMMMMQGIEVDIS
jgi:hypothetical protein